MGWALPKSWTRPPRRLPPPLHRLPNDTPAEENATEKPAAAHLVPEDLADMTVANLKKMAADMGIDTKALKTKDALIQAICAEEVYPGEPMDGPDLGAEAPVV